MSGRRIAVIGGGAWGTALAMAAARAGNSVSLWARNAETIADINLRRENAHYLPGVAIDPAIVATIDPMHALDEADDVLLAVPAQTLRPALQGLAPSLPASSTLVLCAKGIEVASGKLLSEVVGEIVPAHPLAALSGPGFAKDVARGLPTAVVVAARDEALASKLAATLSSPAFRCYSTDDLAGVEIGGALKNVLAIAAGAVAGAALGASAHAAMVTRGFVELRRIAASFGARPETLMGLSGLGDLILTCSSSQSRNYAYGLALGRGEPIDHMPLAEGVPTCGIAARIAAERGIEAPIIIAVDALLKGTMDVKQAVAALMTRPLRGEDE